MDYFNILTSGSLIPALTFLSLSRRFYIFWARNAFLFSFVFSDLGIHVLDLPDKMLPEVFVPISIQHDYIVSTRTNTA